ncbi:MAG: ArsR family transcriptional regulator, partial [Atribacterota bacterium]|nr:ArsR family transcriptional regulator [Atribacterota bacterium]
MKEFITITKALSDVNRVRILLALDGRELCVCQLIVLL